MSEWITRAGRVKIKPGLDLRHRNGLESISRHYDWAHLKQNEETQNGREHSEKTCRHTCCVFVISEFWMVKIVILMKTTWNRRNFFNHPLSLINLPISVHCSSARSMQRASIRCQCKNCMKSESDRNQLSYERSVGKTHSIVSRLLLLTKWPTHRLVYAIYKL